MKWPDFSSKKWRIILFAVIALANIIIYYPSLYHIPRADQWCYLADTADYDGWFSLVTKFYSYNRVRLFSPGDTFLFRPVMFVLLGTEKWAFGHDFFYWQLTGIVLHLILVWLLLKLLLKIHPGLSAYLLAFFFSTLAVGMEMVIWHHINGYILFMIFMLGALYHAYSHVLEGQTKKWRLWVVAAYLTPACFIHELGLILPAMLILYFFASYSREEKPLSRKWLTVLLIPLMLYFSLNYLDSLMHSQKIVSPLENNDSMLRPLESVGTFFYLTFSWLYMGIFPMMSVTELTPGGRVTSVMPDLYGVIGTHSYVLTNPLNYISLFAVIIFFWIMTICIKRLISLIREKRPAQNRFSNKWDAPFKKRAVSLIFFTVFFLIFMVVVVVTRAPSLYMYVAEANLLNFNMYYSYFCWLFFTVTVYMLLETVGFERLSGAWGGYLKSIAAVVLLSLTLLNGCRVYDVNRNMKEIFEPTLVFIKQVDGFINAHRNEPDFSFAFVPRPKEDAYIHFLKKEGEIPVREYYMSDVIYKKDVNYVSPKYLFHYQKNIDWGSYSRPILIHYQDGSEQTTYRRHVYEPEVWYIFQ